MTNSGKRRAGWYADPLGHADLRWWDSENWTTQVTSARAETGQPVDAPRAVPLQWADEEPPSPNPVGGTSRVSPSMPPPVTEPKFALGAKSANGQAVPEPVDESAPDWSALMRALLMAGDNIVTASASSIPMVTIDMAKRTYWWDWSLDSFPAHPVDLVVHSIPRADATIPAIAGHYSEPLLWRVGAGSHALSKHVDPTLRYKLRRWPDFASLPHTVDELRAIKALASAQLTPIELSAIADVAERDARRLIGTFELMSLLDSARDTAAAR